MPDDVLRELFRRVPLKNGEFAELLPAALEFDHLRDLWRGDSGVDGRHAFLLVYRLFRGESLSADERAILTDWGLTEPDGDLSPVKCLLLSAATSEQDNDVLLTSPFADTQDQEAASDLGRRYQAATLTVLKQIGASRGSETAKAQLFEQALQEFFADLRASPGQWTSQLKKRDDEPPPLPPR